MGLRGRPLSPPGWELDAEKRLVGGQGVPRSAGLQVRRALRSKDLDLSAGNGAGSPTPFSFFRYQNKKGANK